MNTSICPIRLSLSKIRSTDTQYAEEMLEILYPFAAQYITGIKPIH